MTQRPSDFKNFLIIGSGLSGISAAMLLHSRGYHARVSSASDIESAVLEKLNGAGIDSEQGEHSEEAVSWCDAAVLSPGVRPDSEIVNRLLSRGKALLSEIDIADCFLKGYWIGVTGSNGKTSTVTLLEKMLMKSGFDEACGNIGIPFSENVIRHPEKNQIVELSSFQLKHSSGIRPKYGVILNMSPNHLNWHQDLDDYYASKVSLAGFVDPEGICIANADDPTLMSHLKRAGRKPITVSVKSDKADYHMRDKELCCRVKNKDRRIENGPTGMILPESVSKVLITNWACAAALCHQMGIDAAAVNAGSSRFTPIRHRMEDLGEVRGRRFINDSKSTTEASTLAALSAQTQPTVLIMGGIMKVDGFPELKKKLKRNSKVVVFGSSSRLLADLFSDCAAVCAVTTLREAFMKAVSLSEEGDRILLSPACASFDQYRSFEHRGDEFRDLVNEYRAG